MCATPPAAGRWLVRVLAPRREREAIEGDLHERYARKARELGSRRADAWFLGQAIRSAAPLCLASASEVSAGRWVVGVVAGALITSLLPALITSVAPLETLGRPQDLVLEYLALSLPVAFAGGFSSSRLSRAFTPVTVSCLVALLYAPALVAMIGDPTVAGSDWGCLGLTVFAGCAGGMLAARRSTRTGEPVPG